jgi:predicted aldo/keto reductase-like oxidoreductase
MEKRFFQTINEGVSLLGFGLMRLPTVDKASQIIDYKTAFPMVDKAIEVGVNYFDTAWMYHNGLSEIFAGDVLSRHSREKFFLASKMPTGTLIESGKDVERIFNEQLKKCKVDYFDFYLMHRLTKHNFEHSKRLRIYEYLSRKKREGYIRHLGFSFHDISEVLKRIVAECEWEFGQIQLNYIDWDACDAKTQYDILVENQLPVVVMEPLRGGSLASLNKDAVSLLKKASPGESAASWALRFAASFSNVMTVLSGMSSIEQVLDNAGTMNNFVPISNDEKEIINKVVALYNAAGTIPCTGCRYCMDCVHGVDIPRVFSIYNRYCIEKNRMDFANSYITLNEKQRAHNCIGCGKCVKQCPQNIMIPQKMKEIAAFSKTFDRL